VHPLNGEHTTSKVVIGAGELRSNLEPGRRSCGAARLDVDEGKLAQRGDRGRDVSYAPRNLRALVEEDRSLLIAAAQAMNEGRAKPEQTSGALMVVA
jgi:hypothetical protein